MPSYSFEAILIRPEGIGTWTYLKIPKEISAALGSKGQVRVKGTINGYPFRSTALPHGDGTHDVVVGKELREQIHAVHGDAVKVTIELDLEERQLPIPEDLSQALSAHPKAKMGYEKLFYSQQKLYVDWIASAKQAVTRQSRIEKALGMLSEGKKLR